jgi:excisionase family DNA binding protein
MPTESHKNALPERMLSVKQVASILSVHPNTVRRWEREGLLKAYRVGPRGSLRFAEDEILDFVNKASGGAYGVRNR